MNDLQKRIGCSLCILLMPLLAFAGFILAVLVAEEYRVVSAMSFAEARHGYVDYDRGRMAIELSHADLTDEDLRRIVSFDPDQLRIDGNPRITDEGLRILKNCRDLRYLSLRKTSVTAEGVREFVGTSSVPQRFVTHSTIDLTANGNSPEMQAAARFFNHHYVAVGTDQKGVVIALSMEGPAMKAGGLKLLRLFPALERVGVRFDTTFDEDVRLIAQCPKLRSLDLAESRITDRSLEHLAGMSSLEWLSLARTQISDDGMAAFGKSSSLRRLDLSGTRITDETTTQLGQMTSLEDLSLDQTVVTDKGLERLAGLPCLKRLSLSGTRVTDSCVGALIELPALQRVDLSVTEVTPKSATMLREFVEDVIYFEPVVSGEISSEPAHRW